jgi:cytoskeletal protein RodZ
MNERDPGLSSLWRAAAHPEPAAELDARILARAQRAARPRARYGWRPLLAFASVAVVTGSLGLLAYREGRLTEPRPDEAPAGEAASAPAQAPAIAAPAAAPQLAAPPPRPRVQAPQGERQKPAAASTEPAPPARRAEVEAEGGVRPAADAAAPAIAPAAPAPALRATEAPAGARAKSAADVPAAGQAQSTEAAASFPAPAQSDRAAPGEIQPPEQLVERIRAARARGDDAEARRLLALLRERHPAYLLPEDLR